ncbi:MAG: adenosylhomocysteinase, partial [Candidatus Caldarchaeum sp.]
GHPSEVMDLSFSLQAESLRYLIKNVEKLGKHVYTVPREIDEAVAALKLAAFGVELEKLTPRQHEYMRSWMAGT